MRELVVDDGYLSIYYEGAYISLLGKYLQGIVNKIYRIERKALSRKAILHDIQRSKEKVNLQIIQQQSRLFERLQYKPFWICNIG